MERTQLQRYSRHVYFDADEQEYVALCSEFPHVSAYGETPEDALAELDIVLEGAVGVHQDEGWPIPEPLAPPEVEALPSGKFVARLPKSLHARLVKAAKEEGVSLNSLVIALLSAGSAGRGVAIGANRSLHETRALFERFTRYLEAPRTTGNLAAHGTIHLGKQLGRSDWRDAMSDSDDADWFPGESRRAAPNREKAMVN